MADKIKTLSHISLAEFVGSPILSDCGCGKTHCVLVEDFDLDTPEIKPRDVVRLRCVHHYEYLQNVLCADSKIEISADFNGRFRQFIGNAMIRFFTWRLNRRRS